MKMGNARHLGTISLCGVAAGFGGLELLLRTGMVSGTGWKVLAAAFEAGTIGAMADWFAVTALFREVPIPILRRHTNIIVRNRVRIVDGIADMVQNRWLSPQVIREHLAKVSPSTFLVEHLDTPEKQEKVARIVRDVLAKVAKSIDGPEVASFLERTIKDQLAAVEIHGALGRWFNAVLSRGDHHTVWDMFLSAVEKGVTGPEVRKTLHRLFEEALEAYREEGGFFRRSASAWARCLVSSTSTMRSMRRSGKLRSSRRRRKGRRTTRSGSDSTRLSSITRSAYRKAIPRRWRRSRACDSASSRTPRSAS